MRVSRRLTRFSRRRQTRVKPTKNMAACMTDMRKAVGTESVRGGPSSYTIGHAWLPPHPATATCGLTVCLLRLPEGFRSLPHRRDLSFFSVSFLLMSIRQSDLFQSHSREGYHHIDPRDKAVRFDDSLVESCFSCPWTVEMGCLSLLAGLLWMDTWLLALQVLRGIPRLEGKGSAAS